MVSQFRLDDSLQCTKWLVLAGSCNSGVHRSLVYRACGHLFLAATLLRIQVYTCTFAPFSLAAKLLLKSVEIMGISIG